MTDDDDQFIDPDNFRGKRREVPRFRESSMTSKQMLKKKADDLPLFIPRANLRPTPREVIEDACLPMVHQRKEKIDAPNFVNVASEEQANMRLEEIKQNIKRGILKRVQMKLDNNSPVRPASNSPSRTPSP